MSALRKLFQLPAAERRLLLEATAVLIAVRLGLACATLPRLRRMLARVRVPGPRNPVPAQRVAWAVVAATRHLPGQGDTCLARALTAEVLLRRHGHAAALRIGVARVGGEGFAAHAWVETEGRILLGAAERPGYTELPGLYGGTV
jgi:hypothetical protein